MEKMSRLWANDDVWIAKLKRNLQCGSYDKLRVYTLHDPPFKLLPSLYKHRNHGISHPCHVNPANQKQIVEDCGSLPGFEDGSVSSEASLPIHQHQSEKTSLVERRKNWSKKILQWVSADVHHKQGMHEKRGTPATLPLSAHWGEALSPPCAYSNT